MPRARRPTAVLAAAVLLLGVLASPRAGAVTLSVDPAYFEYDSGSLLTTVTAGSSGTGLNLFFEVSGGFGGLGYNAFQLWIDDGSILGTNAVVLPGSTPFGLSHSFNPTVWQDTALVEFGCNGPTRCNVGFEVVIGSPPTTGFLTLFNDATVTGGVPSGSTAATFSTVLPEPGTLLLCGAGLAALALRRR